MSRALSVIRIVAPRFLAISNMKKIYEPAWFFSNLILFLDVFLDGQFEQWCIADEQTPDDELQVALDWACGKGGANCSMIQVNQPCYVPNTVREHASYAFNSYYQKFKNKGGSCYFKGAAMITELDPSKKHQLIISFFFCLIIISKLITTAIV